MMMVIFAICLVGWFMNLIVLYTFTIDLLVKERGKRVLVFGYAVPFMLFGLWFTTYRDRG